MRSTRNFVNKLIHSARFRPIAPHIAVSVIAWSAYFTARSLLSRLPNADLLVAVSTMEGTMLGMAAGVSLPALAMASRKSSLPCLLAAAAIIPLAALGMTAPAIGALGLALMGTLTYASAQTMYPRGLAITLSAWAAAGLSALGHGEALAAKSLDIRDGDTAITVVSVRDQTRIRVERGRVLDVYGDIFDTKNNPGGRLVLLKDETEGEVFVKFLAPVGAPQTGVTPVAPAVGASDESTAASDFGSPSVSMAFGGPLKLDVKTTRGTVGLLLHPSNVVGDTLVLRVSGGAPKSAAEPRAAAGRAGAHVRSVKALTLAMAVPEYAGEAPSRPVAGGGEEVLLWKEARFVLKARHDAPGLVGESYVLTNVSASRMVIDERELYREGVLSVAVRQLALDPGEFTPVWIVRSASDRD